MSFAQLLAWMLPGLWVTATVGFASLAIAAPLALVLGIAEHRLRGWPQRLVTAFIEFWRGSSVVILLFFFYYVGPTFNVFLDATLVGALVIGCNIGAYGSQALRAALQSLPIGQVEAGLSLGLHRNQVLWTIELPQALRQIVPIAGNELIEIIKTTANVSLIGLADVTFRAKEAMQASFQPAPIYGGLLLIYVVLCLPFAIGTRLLTRRLHLAGRSYGI